MIICDKCFHYCDTLVESKTGVPVGVEKKCRHIRMQGADPCDPSVVECEGYVHPERVGKLRDLKLEEQWRPR